MRILRVSMTNCRRHPPVRRYNYRRCNICTFKELRQDVAAGPRTLRCREDLGDVFDRASSEIQTLEAALESVLAKLWKELEPPVPAPEMDVKSVKTQSERS